MKLDNLKNQLASIQAASPSNSSDLQQRQIREEIEVLLDREEMYYHQRSRIRWLQYGDKNISFFHASVVQRRQRNQLLRLKDENGDWLSSEGQINHQLGGYFSSLFKGSNHRNMEAALSAIPQVISHDMNISLTRPVSNEEIKLAVFQLLTLSGVSLTQDTFSRSLMSPT